MDLTISTNLCGNPNCIGIGPFGTEGPKRLITIEGVWTLQQLTIEKAIVGLLSHETIEYLVWKFVDDNIHQLLGECNTSQYIKAYHGLPEKKKRRT